MGQCNHGSTPRPVKRTGIKVGPHMHHHTSHGACPLENFWTLLILSLTITTVITNKTRVEIFKNKLGKLILGSVN